MSKNVLTVNISETLEEVAKKMREKNIGCVIVIDKIATLGIVTERDFVTKIVAERKAPHAKIFEVMSSPLITIKSDETIWEAAEIMKEKSIHKLPVLEDEEIVGIITTTDIVKISSLGSDSQMRKICDQILMRMKDN
ncbi:CBS domain-containing protein [Nitrosopumilus sp.]|uniref:CBS domain-containing protein n=1 Tax=Nitrosopumilus sp. TaxID=2024843 RepID=UPI003D1082AE